ncbi:lamin tail domain-containing protein [Candidatus Woesearchaeota archaeon]|nr:lamin tail domain-containing protein [Candidatus Woesearchaeota archaeon]
MAVSFVSAELIINEIMYNPEGSDNNKEFIEVFSDEGINLSDYIIEDGSSHDSLELLFYYNSSYSLIVEEGFNYTGINASVYSAGATIGNNLNNEWDLVIIKDNNGSIVDAVSYSSSWGADGNGRSLCRIPDKKGLWQECNPTPGEANSNLCSDPYMNYTSLNINEFFPNPAGDDNAPMPGGEFIEIHNKANYSIDIEGLYLKDSGNHKLYITGTTTIEGTVIEPKGHLAVYTNGFSGFLNNDGHEEIMLYDPYGELIDAVSYSNSEESLAWALANDLWQHRLPSPNKVNPEQEVKMESSFNIEGLEGIEPGEGCEFGDIVKVKFHAYKGNTSKSSIKIYIENEEDRISQIAKAALQNRYANYSLTIPMLIKPNCNEKYEDGDYYVKIGWTSSSKEEDSFRIKVDGINENNCGKMYVEKKPKKGTLNHNLLEAPGTIEPDEDFTVTVELTNNDGVDHMVELYSYVYRGKESYSGEKDSNKKSVLVKAGQTRDIELKNTVDGAKAGDYKLKIKVKRDDQKTEKEITQPIKLLEKRSEEESGEIEEKTEVEEKEGPILLEPAKGQEIIYESSSVKARKSVVSLFIGLLVVYAGLLTWKR